MKFDVKYTDGFGCYVVTTEDGQAALVDTRNARVDWSDTMETFLRFGPFDAATETPPARDLADLDALLSGRAKIVEVDPQDWVSFLEEQFGNIFKEDHADEG
jgi:hypothetical protein